MPNRHIPFRAPGPLFVLILVMLSSVPAFADTPPQSRAPAIQGYSPVSYFTQGVPEKGRAEYAVTHKGKTYFLTSAEQVRLFHQEPEKYRPKHDVCPYSLTLGKRLPIDPRNFKIVGNSLLLFHLSDGVDGLAKWNAAIAAGQSDAELLRRANAQLLQKTF